MIKLRTAEDGCPCCRHFYEAEPTSTTPSLGRRAEPFSDTEWLFEVKWDELPGARATIARSNEKALLRFGLQTETQSLVAAMV